MLLPSIVYIAFSKSDRFSRESADKIFVIIIERVWMAVILDDVVDQNIWILRQNSHIKGEEELEVREASCSLEHLRDTISHPIIRTNVKSKSFNSSFSSNLDVVLE